MSYEDPDPIEERDVKKLILLLEDPRVQEKLIELGFFKAIYTKSLEDKSEEGEDAKQK